MDKIQQHGSYQYCQISNENSKDDCLKIANAIQEQIDILADAKYTLDFKTLKIVVKGRNDADSLVNLPPNVMSVGVKATELGAEIPKKHRIYYKCEIPLKLPSLNEYVDACRNNPYRAAKMKKGVENDIMWFVKKLPKFDKPIFIHYHWIEGNRRRDYDNICGGGRKFILDAMVKAGRLKDDNRNCVVGHTDTFGYEKDNWKVILEIEERNE